MIDPAHPLVRMSREIDWQRLEEVFGQTYCGNNGRPGVSTRLMVALQYFKYTFDLSDEETVAGWMENPYWQYFSGNQYFEHRRPVDSSSMTRFRKRIGEAGAEELLKETIAAGLRLKAITPQQLKRVNVDTTVQEKNIRHPTDARLYDRAREVLVKKAGRCGIKLRQSYKRVSKQELLNSHRYAHARQMKRASRSTKKLKTMLGCVIRDIERKAKEKDATLSAVLSVAKRIHQRKRNEKGKIYSVHEPHVECIGKGKAHKKYEFGNKASIAATSRGSWVVGAKAEHGSPYDGHTLGRALAQIERIAGRTPEEAFVDMGYQGHGYTGPVEVHVDKRRRGNTPRALWKRMKHRAAIEPVIGHLKSEHRLDRNRLKGVAGDQFNVLLSGAGMNFGKLLKAAARLFAYILRTLARRSGCRPNRYPETALYAVL